MDENKNHGKPVVYIDKAFIHNKRLYGFPRNHYNTELVSNKFLVCTSLIVRRIDANTVETLNTVYNVLSWNTTPEDGEMYFVRKEGGTYVAIDR